MVLKTYCQKEDLLLYTIVLSTVYCLLVPLWDGPILLIVRRCGVCRYTIINHSSPVLQVVEMRIAVIVMYTTKE